MGQDGFQAFVRDDFGPWLGTLGYRRKGGAFEKHQTGVSVIAIFMRYHEPRRGFFNVRLQVALTDFVPELGAVVSRDLSTLVGRDTRPPGWRIPDFDAPEREHVSAELLEALDSTALPWLETFLDVRALAAHLELEKFVEAEADVSQQEILAALANAGIRVAYQSPGLASPRAGKVRPAALRALSFCYQLTDQWDLALRAWDDYAAAMDVESSANREFVQDVHGRRAFLQSRM